MLHPPTWLTANAVLSLLFAAVLWGAAPRTPLARRAVPWAAAGCVLLALGRPGVLLHGTPPGDPLRALLPVANVALTWGGLAQVVAIARLSGRARLARAAIGLAAVAAAAFAVMPLSADWLGVRVAVGAGFGTLLSALAIAGTRALRLGGLWLVRAAFAVHLALVLARLLGMAVTGRFDAAAPPAAILALLAVDMALSTALVLGLLRALHDAARGAAEREARTDPLTGLANRRAFDERLAAEVAHARRHGTALSVVLLDLDHFKALNDRHGHAGGDATLVQLAERLRGLVRAEDVAARTGGEEFALVLPATPPAGAVVVAERLRALLHARPIGPHAARVTASLGVAGIDELPWSAPAPALAALADRRLYEAKRRRDAVVWTGPGQWPGMQAGQACAPPGLPGDGRPAAARPTQIAGG